MNGEGGEAKRTKGNNEDEAFSGKMTESVHDLRK
ncbi:hypothetical protein ROTAS13_04507 [Roseomonas sp. TAS13]|nr:hypothetical protein ROTAS13_04507 [Roseomonas sp. TAS13]